MGHYLGEGDVRIAIRAQGKINTSDSKTTETCTLEDNVICLPITTSLLRRIGVEVFSR